MHHVSGQSLAFDKNCDESAKRDLLETKMCHILDQKKSGNKPDKAVISFL